MYNKETKKRWRDNNKDKIKLYDHKRKKRHNKTTRIRLNFRLKNDPAYRLSVSIRKTLSTYKKRKGVNEEIMKIDIVGCSMIELKEHLEKQFIKGMSWNTWKVMGWHIDHIKPLCKFDLTNDDEVREAFNYKNLQPLWWKDNLAKAGS